MELKVFASMWSLKLPAFSFCSLSGKKKISLIHVLLLAGGSVCLMP